VGGRSLQIGGQESVTASFEIRSKRGTGRGRGRNPERSKGEK